MRLVISIALLAILCIVSAHATCPVSTCSLTDPLSTIAWLNTTSMAAAVQGASVTFYPRKRNGDVYFDMSARLRVNALAELTPAIGEEDQCEVFSQRNIEDYYTNGRMPRHILMENACCDTSTISDTFMGGIERDRAIVNITNPDWPDFYMLFSTSTVDETVTINRPPTDNIGQGYIIEYEAQKIKMDLEIHNWPWITDEQPEQNFNDTFLQFFFMTDILLDEPGQIVAVDDDGGKYLRFSATSTNAILKIDFLKVYTADGVDHFSHTNKLPFTVNFPSISALTDFPAIISLCQNNSVILPRYQNMTYDPNLNAIFLGDAPIGSPETPQAKAKSRLHPAAYAVPIAVVACIIIAGAVYAFVFLPKKGGLTKASSPAIGA